MTVIALVAAFAAPALSAINGNEVSRAVYNVNDVLNEARSYAMSKNTYVYVGLVSDASTSPSSLVIGMVASTDGTQTFSPGPPSLNPITKIYRLKNIAAVSLPAPSANTNDQRKMVDAKFKMGDNSFASGTTYSFILSSYTFKGASGQNAGTNCTSAGILQIDPQGVVSEVGGDPAPLFEIGLKTVAGNQSNYAALQIAGMSGAVRIYRP